MHKIFGYECKRLLWNKLFLGLLLVTLFYGWQVLNGVTILGVSHTAPFSPWSFGDYLSRVLPFIWIGTLFFLTFFTSAKAQRVAVLTDAAQMPPRRYAQVRCAAVLAGAGLLAVACLMEAALFYGWYFGWYAWGELLFPALVILVPALIFSLGSGWLIGGSRPWLIYIWMLLPFVCKALPLPEPLGIWTGNLFTEYPLLQGSLDPDFYLPGTVVLAQCGLLVAGSLLLATQSGKRGGRRMVNGRKWRVPKMKE